MSKLEEIANDDYLAAVLVQLIKRCGHDVLELEQLAFANWSQQQHQHEHPDPLGAAIEAPPQQLARGDGSESSAESSPPGVGSAQPEPEEDLSPKFLDVAALPDGARLALDHSAWAYEDHYEAFIDRGGQVDVRGHRLTTKRRMCEACGEDITGKADCRACANRAKAKAAAEADVPKDATPPTPDTPTPSSAS
jgi:hypothetical protein